MRGTLVRRYTLQCAHWLPHVHRNHKCHRMHGHNFGIEIHVEGLVNEETGMMVDYEQIDNIFSGVVFHECDHRLLNEIPGLDNPTSENFARWIWARMWKACGLRVSDGSWPADSVGISAVVVSENEKCAFIYTGKQ